VTFVTLKSACHAETDEVNRNQWCPLVGPVHVVGESTYCTDRGVRATGWSYSTPSTGRTRNQSCEWQIRCVGEQTKRISSFAPIPP
jgi:hypothetical protein